MKTIKTFFWTVLGYVLVLPYVGYAAPFAGQGNFGFQFPNPLGDRYTTIWALLDKIIDILMRVGLVVAVMYLIYSGFKLITAQGDSDAISDARKSLWHTVIGIIILLSIRLILTLIQNTLEALK
jgi:hypothetical protein